MMDRFSQRGVFVGIAIGVEDGPVVGRPFSETVERKDRMGVHGAQQALRKGFGGGAMEAWMIEPFVSATIKVIETMAFIRPKAGKPYVKKDGVARGDVSAISGLTGETRGTLSVSFSEKSILAIVSSMLNEEFRELNDDIKDAVGEITNMISGQARRQLEIMGLTLWAAIPTVIMGKDHTIAHMTDQDVLAVPFETSDGAFTIEVCLEG